MKILFNTIIFILIIFISYLVLNKKNIETFIDSIRDPSTDIELPIDNKYLPTNINLNLDARNQSNRDYAIINIYSTILNRQPTSSEFIRARNLTENELKLQILNSPEYNHMINMQNNDVDRGILAAVAKEDLLLKIKNIYKNEKNADINPKMLLPIRDCMIHMQYNEYLLRAMFDNYKYDTFEQDVLNTKGLNKEKLLTLFNYYFDLLELKMVANNIIRGDKLNNNFQFNPDNLVSSNGGFTIATMSDNYFDQQSQYIQNNANNLFNRDAVAGNLSSYDNTVPSSQSSGTNQNYNNSSSSSTQPSSSYQSYNNSSSQSSGTNQNYNNSSSPSSGTYQSYNNSASSPSSGTYQSYNYQLNDSSSRPPDSGTQLATPNAPPEPTILPIESLSFVNSIKSQNAVVNGKFGYSCDTDGTYMIIGAPYENLDKSGNVYIYTFNTTTSKWDTVTKLTSPTPTQNGNFGFSCAINNGVIVIGAPDENPDNSGNIYIYRLNGSSWGTPIKITSPTPKLSGNFGYSCDIYNGIIVIGAPEENTIISNNGNNITLEKCGKVYICSLINSIWTLNTTPIISPNSRNHGNFGHSCAIDNNTIVIGAPNENNNNSGNAYVYNISSPTNIILNSTLISTNNTPVGNFGKSCAIHNNKIIIGAPEENTGNVYIFIMNNSNKYTTGYRFPQQTNYNNYGNYCSIYNNKVIISCSETSKTFLYKITVDASNIPSFTLYSTLTQTGNNSMGYSCVIYNHLIGISTMDPTNIGYFDIYNIPSSEPFENNYQVNYMDPNVNVNNNTNNNNTNTNTNNTNNNNNTNLTIRTDSDSYQLYKKVFNPINYQQEYRGMPQFRPNICTSLNQPQLTQPVFTESKLLFQGTSLDQAFEETQVGSIMPKFEYREYEFVKA